MSKFIASLLEAGIWAWMAMGVTGMREFVAWFFVALFLVGAGIAVGRNE